MKHFYLTLFFSISFFSIAFAQDFRMKIRITNPNETFTIPTNINETYNYDVKWSDPYQSGGITIITAFENGFTGDATHTYTEARDYIITIRGTYPRIFFANAGDIQKVVSIEQWGNNTWTSMREAFNGCTNLEINATDTPNLSNCTDMQDMFRECSSLKDNGGAVQNWNVSTITNFIRTFARAPIDETFGNWNVSNAIQMTDMFEGIQLSSDNYDDTLNRWALQSLNNNVVFSAGNSTYCNASLARNNILTNPSEFNWTIIDGGEACEDDKFITTWETTIANETITIPTTGSGYNYTVNWRDGSISVGNTSDATHTFETPGIHTIEIYGDFPRIYFDNSGDRSKILTIEQWGSQQWTTMNAAFEGCNNLKLNADDTPDLSIVTSMEKMFSRTSNLEDLKDKIGSWNTGNIINMSSLFRFSGFNENINAWNVANVQEMGLIFGGTSTFNQPLNNWDVRNVTSLNLAFSNARKFNQDISSWKLQSLANRVGIENLFINATDFNQNLGALDLSNILDNSQLSSFFVGTSMSQENYEATLIGWATLDIANGETRIPRDVSLNSSGLSYCNAAIARQNLINGESWSITGDVLNCTETDKFITTWQTTTANESITIRTSGGGSFYNVEWGDGTTSENQGGNSSHTYATAGTYTVKISGSFARLYTNNFTNIGNKMRSVEQWGTGQWSSFDRAFEGASNVVINATDIPDLSNVTTMFEAFKDCRKLVDNGGQMQNWDVSTIGNFISMFQGANLFDENLGNWDLSSATDLANMLNATNLSTANYDATLIGWAVNPNTPNDLNLGASGLTYCLGESARNTLDIDKNWGINDGGSACAATDFFITTWRTTTANQSITIPTTGSGYNYDIDWGDGTIEFGATGNATHTYTTAGVYKVKILGDFPRIYFNNSADKDKITSIDQWGTQQWTSMERAFYGCTALELNVSDAPDLSQTTSLERMFMGTNNIVDNEASMNLWNTSTITNMANMFADSIFDFNITSWDVGKVENFVGMFNNNAQFNQNIGGWNVGEFVTGTITMQAMFDSASSFNSPLNTWDTAKVTNMVSMFGFATAFNQPLDTWDTSTIENMGGMFFGASDFDQNVGDWNLSSVTNMGAMFQQSGLSIENYDTTLIGWAKQDAGETIPSNISISFEGSQYCFGADARNTLTDTNGLNWSISDDGLACASTDFFITTWQTTATNESITIPTTGSGYDYTIDWGDGTIEFGNTGNASHSYTTAGIYTIKILGDFPQFASLAGGIANAEKLRTIEQWGNIEWQSMLQAFSRCSNMNITAADAPDLSQVTQMSQMFFGCNNLQSPDLSGWDTSNITSMDWMFLNARNFNGDISTWDVGNVTDFTLMLAGVSSFNQDISTWNIGENVIGTVNMNSMLTRTENFDQNLGNWDLQKVTDIDDILANSGLSVANYDATLMGWASNANTPDNLVLGADGLTYCFGEVSRNILTSAPYNWTIDDAGLDCSDAFITTWQTTTTNESITVPTTESGYNYVIDWGDGTIESGFTGNATHEYATSGTYTVKITGDFPRIYFNNSGDKDKLLSVEQWGPNQWTSMESAFLGCSNLVLNASDTPDLSNVTDMNSAFAFTTGFMDNGGEFGNWNVSEVTSMQGIFAFSGMNENINNWNVSKVRDLSSAFLKTPNFNQPLNNWVLTNVNTIRGVFKEAVKFNQPLNDWNISGVNDLSQVFNGAEKFNQPLDTWDVSNVNDFSVVFSGADAFNQSLGGWDISNATNMTLMLRNSGLSQENYDQTLIGWAHLDAGETKIPTDLFLNADNLIYCLGIDARNTLTSALFNWTILDAGTVCTLSDAFITTWQTTAANESITIPTNGSGYTYDIDWGDGTIEYGFTGNATHEYATANTYTVRISGDFPRIYINGNSAARDKIIAVDQWGTQQWTSMENAFRRCSQLVINATDAPDLSLAKSMDAMFDSTSSLVDHGGNMGNWDVSTIEDMSNVFNQSNFDENISTWNVSAVKDFSSIFFRNTSFNQNLDTWDTSACENFGSMFDGATAFNGTIGSWNTEQARSLSNMFRGATTFNQDISAWDTKNVVVINNAFDGATAFNQDLGSWDISSLVENTNSIQHMFSNSGMSTTNYDNTLIGWARLDAGETKIPVGVIFDAENINYCLGEAARNVLTSAPYNWIITDGGFGCDFTNAFITTWQTTTTNESITIPTTGGGYNYIVDWGDGIVETDFTANASHTYTTAGTYTVKIIENFPRIYFNNSGDKDKIIAITQWGTNEWTSMESAFYGCSNVIVDADDTPDLTNVTSLRAMFKGATNLIDTEGTIANWDTRTIVDLGQLFMDAEKFNTPLNSWRFFVAEDLSEMFRGAKTFNQPVNWYTPSVNNLKDMFNGATSFDQNMGSFNISLVTDMSGMFSNAGLSTQNYDQTLAGWFLERSANDIRPNDITFDAGNSQYCLAGDIIEKLTNDHGWQITDSGPGCDESDVFEMTWDLTSENRFTMPTSGNGYEYTLSLSNGEIFYVTSDIVQVSYSENIGMLTVRIYGDFPRFDFDAPFVDKEKLATIEQWGNLQLTEANGAFKGCTNLVLNAMDTPDLSQIQFMDRMFENTSSFVDNGGEINNWNVSTVTSMTGLFEGSAFNENINDWNVSKVDDFSSMFKNNTSFNQPLNNWNTEKANDLTNMFDGATAFNQPVGMWNTALAQYFDFMFLNASSFDQNLGNWDISNTDRNSMDGMLTGSAMSTANYDATLIGWATLETGETQIPTNVQLDIDATYCLGKDARNTLTSAPYNWTITDGGLDCPTPVITLLGDNPQTIIQGDSYTELGATVTYGATLSIDVSLVNTNQLGNYTVTYNASTPSGANADEVIRTVNVVEACPILSLPATNFSITASSETCIDTNNGMISISAATSLDYITTINGVDYNFTSILEVDNLAPGTYSVCIGVNAFTNCEQCFEAVIESAVSLEGKTELITKEVGSSKINVNITRGTAPYTVTINNEEIGTFNETTFDIEVQHGDSVDVVSSIACEGKLTTNVNLINEFILAPNPARDHVVIWAPNTGLNSLQVSLYNAIGVHILSGVHTLNASKVTLPMSALQQGVYFIKINGNNTFKVIKE